MNATFFAISHEAFGPSCTRDTSDGKIAMAYEIKTFASQGDRDAWVSEHPSFREAVKAAHVTVSDHEYGTDMHMTPAQARKAGILKS